MYRLIFFDDMLPVGDDFCVHFDFYILYIIRSFYPSVNFIGLLVAVVRVAMAQYYWTIPQPSQEKRLQNLIAIPWEGTKLSTPSKLNWRQPAVVSCLVPTLSPLLLAIQLSMYKSLFPSEFIRKYKISFHLRGIKTNNVVGLSVFDSLEAQHGLYCWEGETRRLLV